MGVCGPKWAFARFRFFWIKVMKWKQMTGFENVCVCWCASYSVQCTFADDLIQMDYFEILSFFEALRDKSCTAHPTAIYTPIRWTVCWMTRGRDHLTQWQIDKRYPIHLHGCRIFGRAHFGPNNELVHVCDSLLHTLHFNSSPALDSNQFSCPFCVHCTNKWTAIDYCKGIPLCNSWENDGQVNSALV